jgi:hypothetical protein
MMPLLAMAEYAMVRSAVAVDTFARLATPTQVTKSSRYLQVN